MNAASYAKLQLEQTFNLLNATAQGMDDKQYNWKPEGTCNAIAKNHVHILTAVDFFINGVVQGKPLLWQPVAAANGLPGSPLEIWGFSGEISLAVMNAYGKDLQASVLEYVATLSDGDLDREIETQFFGKQPLAFYVQLAGMHTAGHAGDMASVKGMQGLKGLPF